MDKLDLMKADKALYQPPVGKVALVEVPPMQFLMLPGHGDPNTAQEYQDALQALYGVAFTLKFAVKKSTGPDFAVPTLEGLWWVDGKEGQELDIDALMADKSDWAWIMMIRQPDFVTPEMVEQAKTEVVKKKGVQAALMINLELFTEGLSAQTMHIGPYAAEKPTIELLHGFIRTSLHQFRGSHHEIYLSDPRRAAPEKMRTVLRQPVER